MKTIHFVCSLACLAGFVAACTTAAPPPKFKPKSEEALQDDDMSDDNALYRDACMGGNAVSCHDLGKRLDDELKGAQAMTYYERGCTGDYALSCTLLADKYYKGHDTDRNFDRAFPLFEKGCELGDMTACVSLGVMYGNGESVEKDTERARALYKQACDGGYAFACDWKNSTFD